MSDSEGGVPQHHADCKFRNRVGWTERCHPDCPYAQIKRASDDELSLEAMFEEKLSKPRPAPSLSELVKSGAVSALGKPAPRASQVDRDREQADDPAVPAARLSERAFAERMRARRSGAWAERKAAELVAELESAPEVGE